MVSISHKVNLIWKKNPDVFRALNKAVYEDVPKRLGSSHKLVQEMSINSSEEMKILLPSIINISPTDVNWHKEVSNYFHSFGVSIPASGRILEVGYKYDISDTRRKSSINEIMSKNKLSDEKSLANYVESNVDESQKYLYGTPINVEDYIIYRSALISSKVANSYELSDKSTNIEFILSSDKQITENKRKIHDVQLRADKLSLELISQSSIVDAILVSMGIDITNMERIDKEIKFREISKSTPNDFLKFAEDKNIQTKAIIEKCIISGILKRLKGSSIIVDATDEAFIIGNDINEAVSFFSNESPDKVVKVKEYNAKLNSSIKS